MGDKRKMSCKYNNCKICGYKSECKIYKENVELEEKISVLLSCKNCSENKGGLICQKEYENKCLAQKIEFIKELQEENAEWEKTSDKWKSVYELTNNQLTNAKDIIKRFIEISNPIYFEEDRQKVKAEAEQFLKDLEK